MLPKFVPEVSLGQLALVALWIVAVYKWFIVLSRDVGELKDFKKHIQAEVGAIKSHHDEQIQKILLGLQQANDNGKAMLEFAESMERRMTRLDDRIYFLTANRCSNLKFEELKREREG